MIEKILRVSKEGYMEFLFSKKLIIIIFSIVFLYEDVTGKMIKLAYDTSFTINIIEPYILILSYRIHAMVVPLTFIVVMSDFPNINRSGYFVLSRIDRFSWFFGEVLSSFFSALTFLFILAAANALCCLKVASSGTDWSPYITELYGVNREAYDLNNQLFIKTETVAQGTPVIVFIHATLLMLLFLVSISLFLACFKMIGQKRLGVFSIMSITILGMLAKGRLKWAFPINHCIYAQHFNAYFAATECRIIYSYLFFIVLNATLLIIDMILCKHYSISEN
ncbi:MAG: hypothetical protein VZR23_07220 [Lachnospiraceae bacterium]|nr:hypothetical protein [Lachnospiraceae bacterium]